MDLHTKTKRHQNWRQIHRPGDRTRDQADRNSVSPAGTTNWGSARGIRPQTEPPPTRPLQSPSDRMREPKKQPKNETIAGKYVLDYCAHKNKKRSKKIQIKMRKKGQSTKEIKEGHTDQVSGETGKKKMK